MDHLFFYEPARKRGILEMRSGTRLNQRSLFHDEKDVVIQGMLQSVIAVAALGYK